MISSEVRKLESENMALREALRDLTVRIEQGETEKPKRCEFCVHFVQHYIKDDYSYKPAFTPIDEGHCSRRAKTRTRRGTTPDATCKYFELGTYRMKEALFS